MPRSAIATRASGRCTPIGTASAATRKAGSGWRRTAAPTSCRLPSGAETRRPGRRHSPRPRHPFLSISLLRLDADVAELEVVVSGLHHLGVGARRPDDLLLVQRDVQ